MPTTAHLDEDTQSAPRARRGRPSRPRRGRVSAPRGTRVGTPVEPRYPDDPAGNYETTEGGW